MTDDDTIHFPQSRVAPPQRETKQLGVGPLARAIGIPAEQCTGHWCSRCHGIWFGYLLECECPVCSNRHG